ncbi:solute carrier family 43 member 3-like isoform X2 [Dendronephthya gigantea]|uniref:solute carrier family 43 member 3-like isoform X2 n=1 Tax=Dendronephthya gigantea TaxID=151771 RepID=UPI00106B1AEB|nr:solute carrier family 43 member 3-like isoform X2 [Dendronephthya gigantea]XP_028400969.1 solute carrier family 43 member 3-like isoform X2 [Dendronephthya gigantea]
MASLQSVYKQRVIILVWSLVEVMLLSAVIFGWASLVVVLKKEGFFRDLCPPKHEGNVTSHNDYCIKQDKRLNLVFLIGVISLAWGAFVSGAFLDRFGPRKTRLLSSFLFGLTFLFFVLADKDRPNLIFPGILTLSAAGLTLLLTIFQVANMFEKWKSSVISVFNGAVDSSAIVLLFFKLVYDAGVPLRSINIFFYIFAIVAILIFTFILPSFTITSERIREINGSENPESSHDNIHSTHETVDKPLVQGDQANGTNRIIRESESNSIGKTPEKNGKVEQEADSQLSPLFQSEEYEDDEIKDKKDGGGTSPDSTPRLISLMLTSEYIHTTFFLSLCNLRLWFYVGYLNSYLEFMSDNDHDTVSHYTNWFGIAQFSGFVFAPIVGIVMDWKPKGKRNQKTDLGFVVGFFLTSFTAFVLNILVLVPDLSVQYASFVVQVVLRAFVYTVYSAFLLHKFPLSQFGKLYGAGHLISAVIGSIQYGLFTISEDTLEKDPFWVNVGFLVSCLYLNVLPILLWFKERKAEQLQKRNGEKRIVIT